ncbi:MAG: UvrB/UvrC motif-containing protein [Akkermansia sp.]|nr:UvrB/UvrC motif-containing protein [Akkermansia sp.]
MKKCQICGKRASIYLTQIVNGQATDLALCEACARAKGLFDPQSLTFAEKFFPEAFKEKVDKIVRELINRVDEAERPAPRSAGSDMLTRCPVCNFTLDDFRRCGRLGCPDCYHVFAEEINSEHPAGDDNSKDGNTSAEEAVEITRSKLEQQLKAAIEREDYEQAALLRDKIKNLS